MRSQTHEIACPAAHRPVRALLLSGAALFAFAAPGAAFAQEEAQPAVDAPEEAADGNAIIVTATKREQTLQDVPVAVSVTTAETIERAQIRDLKDLSSLVPSLRVAERQASAQTNFLIRGFGNGANNAGIEPSVGVFIDGVYRSRSASQIADLPDVQRVEVLRGPQSTLFGKNASAGVVSITTEKPKFDFGGNVEASYGNYNAIVAKGVITGPLSETVAASLAAGYNKRDGYNRDLATGNRTNSRDRWFVRGQLLYKGDSGLTARLIGDYGKIDENCCGVVSLFAGPATGVLTGALGGKVNAVNERFANIVYNNFDSTNKIDNYGVSGQIDYEAGPLTFTSITAYRKVKALTNQDSDFTSADLLGRNSQDVRIGTFTQELQGQRQLRRPGQCPARHVLLQREDRPVGRNPLGHGGAPLCEPPGAEPVGLRAEPDHHAGMSFRGSGQSRRTAGADRARNHVRRARGQSGEICRAVLCPRARPRRAVPPQERRILDLRPGRFQHHRPADPDRRPQLDPRQEEFLDQRRVERCIRGSGP